MDLRILLKFSLGSFLVPNKLSKFSSRNFHFNLINEAHKFDSTWILISTSYYPLRFYLHNINYVSNIIMVLITLKIVNKNNFNIILRTDWLRKPIPPFCKAHRHHCDSTLAQPYPSKGLSCSATFAHPFIQRKGVNSCRCHNTTIRASICSFIG